MGSMASTVASIIFESCTFAALTRTASGMPWASTTRWRFVPCLPGHPLGPVGFLPVSWLPPGPALRRSPARPGPSRCDRPGPALREAPGAACARRPLGTSLAACASTSYRSHTPSRLASTPRGCPSSARTGSPSAPPGPTPGSVRPWASAAPAGAAARSAPTTHQATVPAGPVAELFRFPDDRVIVRSVDWVGETDGNDGEEEVHRQTLLPI
jgi:hypothetical protein